MYRPRTSCYADLADMATALFGPLIMNHPFVDGNMRIAFLATDVFLRLNGCRLQMVAHESHHLRSD
ncbi:MAG: Fic family protein [Gammaproteobacteria bacterium]|nr:Fic family protein [Gammaproteobacteria bacterium]